MKIDINKNVDILKVQTDAKDLFLSGKYSCSEAVVLSIKNNLLPDMPLSILSAASAFAGKDNSAKCMCGAVSGGSLCIGYVFGRFYPSAPTDPKSNKTLALAFKLQENFKKDYKVLCCKALSKEESNCPHYIAKAAQLTAEIIANEFAAISR